MNLRETLIGVCGSEQEGISLAAALGRTRPRIFICEADMPGDWNWIPNGDALLRIKELDNDHVIRAGLLYAPGFVVVFCRGGTSHDSTAVDAISQEALENGISGTHNCWAVSKDYCVTRGIPTWPSSITGNHTLSDWLLGLVPTERTILDLEPGSEELIDAVQKMQCEIVTESPRAIYTGPNPTAKKLELLRRAVQANGRIVAYFDHPPEVGYSYLTATDLGNHVAVYNALRGEKSPNAV